jgi:fermentation-respiration switch protein FrsA (DUF1100 family)
MVSGELIKKIWRILRMPVKWIYLLCLALAVVVSFYLFYPKVEDFFVFFPQKKFDFVPEGFRLTYRDVYFDTEDGKSLHGWFFPLPQGGPVILYCHGNAGNISHRLDQVSRLLGKNLQVFMFDYRGYGRSVGSPSEKGIYADGVAAYDYLVAKEGLSPDNIVLYGHSLGAAVVVEVALRRKVKSLILESAFTSTREMAKTMFLFWFFSPFVPVHYNSVEKLPRIQVPVLIMHGEADEIVPFSLGERLYGAARAPKFFFPLKGAGHNDTYLVGGDAYFERFAVFAREGR